MIHIHHDHSPCSETAEKSLINYHESENPLYHEAVDKYKSGDYSKWVPLPQMVKSTSTRIKSSSTKIYMKNQAEPISFTNFDHKESYIKPTFCLKNILIL